MALSGDTRGHHSAPSSSGGDGIVDSTNGTPHTSLASGSPDDVRAIKPSNVNLGGKMTASSPQDPFVSTSSHATGRLSAKASTFQPSFEMKSTLASTSSKTIGPYPTFQAPKDRSDHAEKFGGSHPHSRGTDKVDHNSVGTFTTDSNTTRVIKVTGNNVVASFLPFVETSKRKLREHGFAKRGTERVEAMGTSYYLRLSNIRDATELCTAIKLDNPALSVEFVSPVTFGMIFSPGRHSMHEGQVLVTVNFPSNSTFDMKQLDSGLVRMLEQHGKIFAWQKLPGKEVNSFYLLAEYEDASCALGAISNSHRIAGYPTLQAVTVSIDLFRPDLAHQIVAEQMYRPATPTRRAGDHASLTRAFGNMLMGNLGLSPGATSGATPGGLANGSGVSYMASPAPPNCHMSNQLPFAVGGTSGGYLSPGANSLPQVVPGISPPVNHGQGNPAFHSFGSFSPGGYPGRSFDSNPHFQQHISGSPGGYYSPKFQEQSREVGHYNRSGGRRSSIPRVLQPRARQHSSPANSHHNHVDVAKIRQGIDVRTTIMLRNIPNKVDQAMLKEIVDESSFGKYDFMYLRIDFSNNCNVGYAFINFTDPLDIIDFVIARSNHKWHMFKSDKVAEVSYATIQGKDCLVQKFRNSSVMLEAEHYRPKLYKTIHDQLGCAGEEEHFPESDNASKLKRSCENAEHVGLFAPSAGQHLRDEQRRRRSQFDRGTSLAEREEHGFDNTAYDSYRFPPA